MENNTILSTFVDLLSYVVVFKEEVALSQPELDSVSQDLTRLLEKSVALSVKNKLDPRAYDDARFALCALIDESFMTSHWKYKDGWRRRLLQSQLYGSTSAGSEFFDRLNGFSAEQVDLREFYCTCMAIGFSGRYAMDADKVILSQLKRTNINEVLSRSDLSKGLVSGQGFLINAEDSNTLNMNAVDNEPLKGFFASKKRLMLSVAPPLIILFMFFIYSFVIDGVVESFMLSVMEG